MLQQLETSLTVSCLSVGYSRYSIFEPAASVAQLIVSLFELLPQPFLVGDEEVRDDEEALAEFHRTAQQEARDLSLNGWFGRSL